MTDALSQQQACGHRGWVVTMLLALAALQFGLEVVSYLGPGYGEDFAKHWVAPQVLRDGGDPYDAAATRQLAVSTGVMRPDRPYFHFLERFHYPPLDLVLFEPFSGLTLRAATVSWILVGAVLYLGSIPLVLRVLRFEPGSAAAAMMVAALLVFAPALGNLSLGQIDVAVFFALVLGLDLQRRGRPVLAGLAIAVAIHMKLYPGAILLFYLLLRRWRMAASIAAWTAALGAVCLAIVGPQACASWLRAESAYATLQSGWEQYLPSNLSIPAFLLKGAAFVTGSHDAAPLAIALGRVAMVGLLGVGAYTVVRASRRGGDDELWALGALIVATSMSSALTFQHHLLWLALPLGLALREGWEARDAKRIALTFLVPYLLIGTLDPWNQPLRNLTSDLSKPARDILWSIVPVAIALGALWTGAYAVRRVATRGYSLFLPSSDV